MRFTDRLRAVTRRASAPPARDPVGAVREHFGVAPHRDLASILETSNAAWKRRYGAWCARTARLPAPDAKLTDFFARAYVDPFAIVSSFTGTLWIGNDGGGQDYMVEVGPRTSAVYLFGPGVGELKYLADSLDAFLTLNELFESRHAYEGAVDDREGNHGTGGVDGDALRLPELRAAMRRLVHRVHLTGFDRSDMASDFDEVLPRLGGVRPRARPASPAVSDRYARSYWAQANLRLVPGYLPTFGTTGRRRVSRSPRTNDAADAVLRLWDAFLTGRDDALDAVARQSGSSKAALVRRTAELLVAVRDGAAPGELGLVAATREIVRDALANRAHVPSERGATLAAAAPGDTAALAEARRAAFASPDDAKRWDALTFALYETEDWSGMLAAADRRLTLDAHASYPWLQRGIALMQLGDAIGALAAFDRTLAFARTGRDGGAAWMNKAALYIEQGRTAEARAHLRRAIAARPDLRAAAAADPALAPLLPPRREPGIR